MSIKGFPNQKKLTGALPPYTEAQCNNTSEFVTVQPTYSDRNGLDSVQLGVFRLHVSPKTATPNATYPTRIFTSAAHGGKVGDVVRFLETATNPAFESGIQSVPDANTIILNSETPLPILGTDTFYILRYVTPRYDDTGATVATLTQGPITFVLDGVDTEVSQDTAVPANSIPLPVVILNPDGTEATPATAANQTTMITSLQLLDDVVGTDGAASPTKGNAIGGTDGTNFQIMKVDTSGRPDVTVNSSALPTGAATEAKQDDTITAVNQVDNSVNIVDTSVNTLLKPGDTLAKVAEVTSVNSIANALPTGTNSIGQVTANAGTNLNTSALNLEATQAAMSAKLPATLGQKAMTDSMAVVLASDQSSIPTAATLGTETTKVIGNVGLVPSAVSTNAASSIASTANEASKVIKASAGRLYSFAGYNAKTSAQFIQIFNSTTVPADSTAPVFVFTVPASSNWSYDFPLGRYFSTGISVSNSSTQATKTIGSADCWFNAEYL